MRVKLTPTFTSGKMKMMFPTMQKCGLELQKFLRTSADSGESFDIKDVSARYTINMIATCAFGIDANALENPDCEFRIQGKKIFEPSTKRVFLGLFVNIIFPFIGRAFKVSPLHFFSYLSLVM